MEEHEIHQDDILFQSEDYCVVLVEKPNPEFPDGSQQYVVYSVVNKNTGVQEQDLRTMPAAFNWCIMLQEALEKIEEQADVGPEIYEESEQELVH
jgi:hypothetical protein